MTKDQAVVLPFPEEQEMEPEKSDFLDELIAGGYSPSEIHQEVRKVLGEIDLLKRENRWEDIILLCHPIEEKLPLIADSDAAIPIYGEIVFALCQLHRFEEAVSIGIKLVKEQPDNFNAHAQLAFVAYQALIAHQNKEIILPPRDQEKIPSDSSQPFRSRSGSSPRWSNLLLPTGYALQVHSMQIRPSSSTVPPGRQKLGKLRLGKEKGSSSGAEKLRKIALPVKPLSVRRIKIPGSSGCYSPLHR